MSFVVIRRVETLSYNKHKNLKSLITTKDKYI